VRLAQARELPGRSRLPGLAVQDRHQRLPGRAAQPQATGAVAVSLAEVPWLQPYPDRLLDELAPSDTEPDAVVVARETIELTYLAVIQLLPPASGRS
jgi:RNA polymerase sigma-70 factor (ECF subfamily)